MDMLLTRSSNSINFGMLYTMAIKLGIKRRYFFPRKCLSGWTMAKYRSIVTETVTNTEPTLPM